MYHCVLASNNESRNVGYQAQHFLHEICVTVLSSWCKNRNRFCAVDYCLYIENMKLLHGSHLFDPVLNFACRIACKARNGSIHRVAPF